MHASRVTHIQVTEADNSITAFREPAMLIDMHDYTPKAKAYWWLTASAGAVALGLAAWVSLQTGAVTLFEIVFGAGVAVLAGLFAARIPGAKTSAGSAEVVIFLLLLELGPAAA